MATDDADAPLGNLGESVDTAGAGDGGRPATVGEYTWAEYLSEYGARGDAEALYDEVDRVRGETPGPSDWERVAVDPADDLGFPPTETEARVEAAKDAAAAVDDRVRRRQAADDLPATVGLYSWADFDEEVGDDRASALGFDPADTDRRVGEAGATAEALADLVDERTVDVNEELDEDEFFTSDHDTTTIVNRYDLEKAVPEEKKRHFREEERYWVNEPHSFVIIFHSTKENEKKYYVVEPHMNRIEEELKEYLTGKLRTAIKYSDTTSVGGGEDARLNVIESETLQLLERYDLYDRSGANLASFTEKATENGASEGLVTKLLSTLGWGQQKEVTSNGSLEGLSVRPEPKLIQEDPEKLSDYQVDKLLYYLKRDFIGYERIDGIKHDINVEDISCDGYNSPVFVYHSDYEQIISNIYHEEDELDDFVVKLAQRSGKGISKRRPQVDATLPDGSRAQLTLGKEVSDHGTNYTIRQFKDVPFTPIDLINWNTFSLEEMAFLWLSIENNKSLIFAGGTASGKTTSLNAVSLFIPSNAKIVSIEDTREVELPQRNWIASVTRPSFSDDEKGDVDEFDLLEAALRQRPDYIVMGEVRGQEGRTLFQVMSTGHTTYTTFHADSVGEVLKRFTTDPINVSKTMFTALDLVSIQTATRVEGHKVRRNKVLTEINHYDAENDEINVQDVYQWQAETDEFLKMGDSNTLEGIKFDRGWAQDKLDRELFKRQVVLAYLIEHDLNTYTQVAATFQAFINDQETILTLMARDTLEERLEDLREMESVLIDIDPEKEEMVPRPEAGEEISDLAGSLLADAREELFPDYEDRDIEGLENAIPTIQPESEVVADPVESGADAGAASAAAFGDESSESDPAPFGDDGSDEPLETDETFVVGEAFAGEGDGTAPDDGGGPPTAEAGGDAADPTDGEPVAADATSGAAGGRDDVSAVDDPSLDVEADATAGSSPESGSSSADGVGPDDGAGGFVSADVDEGGDAATTATPPGGDTGGGGGGGGSGGDGDGDGGDGESDSWGFGGFTTADPEED
jgi:flagellar protein FlaI